MGEPITLYDKNGKTITVYGQAVMKAMLEAGATLEKTQPAKEADKPADKPKGK